MATNINWFVLWVPSGQEVMNENAEKKKSTENGDGGMRERLEWRITTSSAQSHLARVGRGRRRRREGRGVYGPRGGGDGGGGAIL